MALTDNSPMPYGVHQGKRMEDVPADYLLWLYDNNKCGGSVKAYIEDCMDVLEKEIKEQEKQKKYNY